MAKSKGKGKSDKQPLSQTLPTTGDYSMFYSDMAYRFPDKLKNTLWFAQMLFHAKKNSVEFLDPKKAKKYRNLDKLEIDPFELKRLFDPITPLGGGGRAPYMAADWETNPIFRHAFSIVKTDMLQKQFNIEVNCQDEYAMLRRQKDNYKILYRNRVRDLINAYLITIGDEPISDMQDPYKWMQNFVVKQMKPKVAQDPTDVIDTPQTALDLIRGKIDDDETMQMYNESVNKGDIERAFELGVDYYFFKENKFIENAGEAVVNDLMHFNKCVFRKYTDETTGRPVIKYVLPETLWVLPFYEKNGNDLMGYFWEYYISFADFVREFGRELTPQQLVNVFEYNKAHGAFSKYYNYQLTDVPDHVLNTTNIRIGFFSILTQDYDAFAEEYGTNQMKMKIENFDWKTGSDEVNNTKYTAKHYNVWYNCYYIPPTQNTLSQADFQWQSNFIFKIEKKLDQNRYGNDLRFVKPDLVIWNNSVEASFTDIMERFRKKIDAAWMQFQNTMHTAIPGGGKIIAKQMLDIFLSGTDEANKDGQGNGKDALKKTFDWLRQTGLAVGEFPINQQTGEFLLDPSKLVINLGIEQIEECFKWLEVIGALYNDMMKSLSISDLAEGQDLKPRQALGGAIKAQEQSNKGRWFIERAWEQVVIMGAERIVQHINCMAKESKMYGENERFEEFKNIVGLANGLMIEGIADIPLQDIGLSVINDESAPQKKEYWLGMANEMVKAGMLDEKFLFLMMKTEKWKEAELLYRIGSKLKAKEMQAQQQAQFQQQMQLKDKDLQIALALQNAKSQGIQQQIATQGAVDTQVGEEQNKIKAQTMAEQKAQLLQNKLIENRQKANLEMEAENNKKGVPV